MVSRKDDRGWPQHEGQFIMGGDITQKEKRQVPKLTAEMISLHHQLLPTLFSFSTTLTIKICSAMVPKVWHLEVSQPSRMRSRFKPLSLGKVACEEKLQSAMWGPRGPVPNAHNAYKNLDMVTHVINPNNGEGKPGRLLGFVGKLAWPNQ